jgi:hypothetical protein
MSVESRIKETHIFLTGKCTCQSSTTRPTTTLMKNKLQLKEMIVLVRVYSGSAIHAADLLLLRANWWRTHLSRKGTQRRRRRTCRQRKLGRSRRFRRRVGPGAIVRDELIHLTKYQMRWAHPCFFVWLEDKNERDEDYYLIVFQIIISNTLVNIC